MKICAISFHCCPFSVVGGEGVGGMNVYLKELSSAMERIPRVEFDIFTRVQNTELKGIRRISPGVRVIHLKGGPEHPEERTRLYEHVPEFSRNLEAFILREERQYDVAYSHYWLSGLAGEWLKGRLGLPLVHTYHTLAFLKKKVLGEPAQNLRIKTERHLSHVADRICSFSSEEKQSLMEEYNIPFSKACIVYPGVNKALFYPVKDGAGYQETGFRKEDKVFLYVGRIEPVKGLARIVDALDILKIEDRDLFGQMKLLVIGGGDRDVDLLRNKEFLRIQKAIQEKGLEDKVLFLGSRKQEELRKYYSMAEALIVPSLYESFGLVVVEALACGTPVIVSQVGKMRTIVRDGENGFSFKPSDSVSLAKCLKEFDSRKEILWSKDEIRRDIINRFSWDKTAQEIFGLFTALGRAGCCPTTKFQPGEMPPPA